MNRWSSVWIALAFFMMLGAPTRAQHGVMEDWARTGFKHSASTAGCWKVPESQTVEEVAKVYQNASARERAKMQKRSGDRPPRAVLALSNASQKTAYSAGLLVGWGETAKRPEFHVVTATGVSALIAPFAFLGEEGDPYIADIFTCDANAFEDMARRAASYLDKEVLEKIFLRHEGGARLAIALPGSAARPESVWDLGAIAASRHPKATHYIETILLAAIDPTVFIDPAVMPIKAGRIVDRDQAFREPGAGAPLLFVGPAKGDPAAYYLIHNGVLFPDEGGTFMARRNNASYARADFKRVPVVPAYAFFLAAQTSGAKARIASPRPFLTIQPVSSFDMAYMRALFLDAYRQGRMGKEWRSTFPDMERSYH